MNAKKRLDAKPSRHADGATSRAETPELEGRIPLPEEITGRASGTGEDLIALFDDQSAAHVADGFRGGSGDVPRDGVVKEASEAPAPEV